MIWNADVANISPPSGQIEELWVLVGFDEGVEELCQLWKFDDKNFGRNY